MRKVLLTALCLLLASPSLALAGSLQATGQAFVFGIFGAPPPAQMTWFEADGVTKLGGLYVNGANPVGTSFDGRFAFSLAPSVNIIRFGSFIRGEGNYFNGFFHVVGNSAPIDVLAGPSQTTTLTNIVVNMF
jgi:hypothetical protein